MKEKEKVMRIGWLALASLALMVRAEARVEFPIPEIVRSWEASEFATNGVRAVWLEGVPWKGKSTRIFAYYGLPSCATEERKVPGIVLVHGGGGAAFHRWVHTWVARRSVRGIV